jgi:hypothetical protein
MAANKQVKVSDRKPPNAGKGRPKGSANKTTTALKEAILQAGEAVGADGEGAEGLTGYLKTLARTEPKAFSSLLGKVLPLQVQGSGEDGELLVSVIERRIVKAGS